MEIKAGKKGFTILEIVITSVIVALALIPVFDMISGANRALASIDDESVAFALATESCEWMSSLSYRELWHAENIEEFPVKRTDGDGVEFVEEPVSDLQFGDVLIDYEPVEQFRRFRRYTKVFLPTMEGMPVLVRVTVVWRAKTGAQEHSIELEFKKFSH
jgi:prepilin-type N-terminal cleavage/methylation domain-containing protein